MTDTTLVPAGPGRSALVGLELPSPPPARIYIGAQQYRLAAPNISLPPAANMVKTVLNWVGPLATVAKNVLHIATPPGFSTTDAVKLLDLANAVHGLFPVSTSIANQTVSNAWTLQNVMCGDLSGSGAQAVSTHAATPGAVTGNVYPPQTAVCISWEVGTTYKGGKPRTYVAGIPMTATSTEGSSTISSAYATAMAQGGLQLMNGIDGLTVDSLTGFVLGLLSYRTGHTVRPTPLFHPFVGVRVHERLDSQRRRSGKESGFPETP